MGVKGVVNMNMFLQYLSFSNLETVLSLGLQVRLNSKPDSQLVAV